MCQLNSGIRYSTSLIPRPSHRPVFDCLQAKLDGGKGLGNHSVDRVTWAPYCHLVIFSVLPSSNI